MFGQTLVKQILRSLIYNQEARSFQFNDFFLNIYAYNDSYSSCYSKVKTKGCLIENVNFRLHRTIDSKSSSEGGPARLKIDDGAKRNESRSWRSNLSSALYQITNIILSCRVSKQVLDKMDFWSKINFWSKMNSWSNIQVWN